MILTLFEALAAEAYAYCIVGGGPVGLALGLALARVGMRVLVLESGGPASGEASAALARTEIVDPERHASSDATVRRGLGGTSRVWGAGCTPYDPIDFEMRPHLPLSGAPYGASELAPYEAEACAFFGCGGPGFDLGDDPPGERLRSGQIIRFAREADMGLRHRAEIEALPNLTVCLDTTVTRLALDPGTGSVDALEARSGGRAVRIAGPGVVLACGGIESARLLLCAQREHPRLLGGETGPLGRYYMGHISGCVSRIHFGERWFGERFAFRQDTDGTYFRRRLTFAPQVLTRYRLLNTYFLPGNFPLGDARMASGALSALHLALTARHGSVHYMRHYQPSYVATRFRPDLDVPRHVRNVLRDPLGTVTGLADIFRQRLARAERPPGLFYDAPSQIFALNYHAEQVPDPESRVTLGAGRDSNGVPLPRVDLRFGTADISSVLRSHIVLDRLLRQAGRGWLEWMRGPGERVEHVRAQAMDGYHQIGLTRMACSPREGVVDGDLAVHGFRNLWVAGTGVLPTGSQAHPTFSAVSRALRLAQHLASGRRVSAAEAPPCVPLSPLPAQSAIGG
jgi:choline dehydrogenase-like flavoprotein